MKIPFFNYPALYEENANLYQEIFKQIGSKGAFIMQKELECFETELAEYLNCKYAIGVADGTAALTFSLKAANIKPGDEVIVSSHTFIATAAAIQNLGATPVLVDCLPDSTINTDLIEKAITPSTKAIMPTQLNGRISNMTKIEELSLKYKLKIIEDSCQALGAKYKGKYAGLFGEAGSFSFFPAKTLGCFGDGGAVVTNSPEVAEKIFRLRNHGRDSDGFVREWGHNGRLDNLQAAILSVKLKNYKLNIERRRHLANIYFTNLSSINDLILPPSPELSPNHYDIYQNFEVQIENRDEFRKYLLKNGIGTIIQWGGWMLHHFKDLHIMGEAPYANLMSKRMVLIPMHHLISDNEINYICSIIKSYFK